MPDMLEVRPAALLQILEIATHAGVAAAWLRLAGTLDLTDDPGTLFPLLRSLLKALAQQPEDDLPAPLVAIAPLLVRLQAQPVTGRTWIAN